MMYKNKWIEWNLIAISFHAPCSRARTLLQPCRVDTQAAGITSQLVFGLQGVRIIRRKELTHVGYPLTILAKLLLCTQSYSLPL